MKTSHDRKPYYLATGAAKAAQVPALVVVLARIVLGVLERQLHLRDHQVIGLVVAGVSAHDQALQGEVLAAHLVAVGQPLHGERGPLQGVRDDQVVEERRVLLPDLVLLVHQPLLHLISVLLLLFSHGCEPQLLLCCCCDKT